MSMTQKRADEIAYLGQIREVLKYCDIKGITEVTAIEKLPKVEDKFAEDIANYFHIERAEAIEFTRFIFNDVIKALAKRKEATATRIRDLSL